MLLIVLRTSTSVCFCRIYYVTYIKSGSMTENIVYNIQVKKILPYLQVNKLVYTVSCISHRNTRLLHQKNTPRTTTKSPVLVLS